MSRSWISIGLACVLAACQNQAPGVPIEEAKRAVADFGAPSLVAPPRTIDDVTDTLDRERPDPVEIAERTRLADAPMPEGLGPAAKADFLIKRSLAAKELGRTEQRLADTQESVRQAETANLRPHSMRLMLRQLDDAYSRAGLQVERLQVLDRELALAQSSNLPLGEIFALRSRVATLTSLGRDEDARHDFERMRAIRTNIQSLGRYDTYDVARVMTGAEAQLLLAHGKYRDAEPLQREAVQSAEAMLNQGSGIGLSEQLRDEEIRAYAVVLRGLGRLAESEAEARRALSYALRREGKYSANTAYAVQNLADALLAEGRLADVERLDRAVVDIYEHIGHGPGSLDFAQAYARLGETLTLEDKAVEGAEAFVKGVALVAMNPGLKQRVEVNLLYALALTETKQPQQAFDIAQRSIEARSAVFGSGSYDVAEARAVSAIALFELNDRPRAIAEFRAAVPVLLARPSFSGESAEAPRRKILQWLFGRFLDLLSDHGRGITDHADMDDAFRIADAGHGQAVQEALSAAAARAPALDPGLAAVIREEQDERLEITALEATLSNVLALPAGQRRAEDVSRLRAALDGLRTVLDARGRDIERSFPSYARLTHPAAPTLEAARAALRPGEALIVTAVTELRTYVWAIPQNGAPAFAAVPPSAGEIAQQVARLRAALDPHASRLSEIPPYDVATAHALYQVLLEPVKAGWRNAKSLVLVPDRALAQLPFGVLVTKPVTLADERQGDTLFASYRTVPWLARDAAITQLPSVAALTALREVPPPPVTRRPFIGFGDPWFSAAEAAAAKTQVAALPAGETALRGGGALRFRSAAQMERLTTAQLADLPRLPDTAGELRGIATALGADPAKDVFVGAAANERAVKTADLADRRVIAFATHGLVPGDLNGLTQPALALSAPQVAQVDGDGLLTMDEVLGLKLNADWVVLSACNTAAGEGAGAEALSGLGRAFFYAGTRALLASNWPVETRSARTLTTDLFRRQAKDPRLTRAEALRQAELALMDGPGFVDRVSGKTVFSYAHPIFWAPFSLVGDGG